MAKLSTINLTQRIALPIGLMPYWQDHRFMGQAVLPAVESMAILASAVRHFDPSLTIDCPGEIHFDKFLELPHDQERLDAFCDLTRHEDGSISAVLVTRKKAKSSFMTRTLVHAGLNFTPRCEEIQDVPLSLHAELKGRHFILPSQDIYAELVPFGPSYQTLKGNLQISQYGVWAGLKTPPLWQPESMAMFGSPFALDGAMHAACVWTQRYKSVVAFPISISQRVIISPTLPDRTYHCRILPTGIQNDIFYFDIWIFDDHGHLNEVAQSVGMRDVSQGRLHPPDWIMSDQIIL